MSVSRQSAPQLIAGQGPVVHGADPSLTPAADASVAGDILTLIAAAELAARYLDHPDVQAIPFARPASSVVELLRATIAKIDPSPVRGDARQGRLL